MFELESIVGDATHNVTAAFVAERPRLIRFCARITGDWEAAEDLAQETLTEAWRVRTNLRDIQGLSLWLNAIARHVCLRWLRSRARDLRHLRSETPGEDTEIAQAIEVPAISSESDDFSLSLERGELAELLDRALALLPGEMRYLLIETYLRERSHNELAARAGLNAGALRARLHRGRLALRRVLSSDLRADALAAGILPPETSNWHETRIWCPFCARHRLEVLLDRKSGEYSYRCAGDCQPGSVLVGHARDVALLNTLASPKAILTRHCLASYTSYRDALARREDTCPTCSSQVAMRQWLPGDPDGALPADLFLLGVYIACPTCGPRGNASPWHLTLDTPHAMRFWRRHPRMRALPTREIEHGGRAALVTGFESHETADKIEIVSARDTYEVLHIFGDPEQRGDAEEDRA